MLDDEKGDFVGTAVREVSILGSWLLNTTCTKILNLHVTTGNKPPLYWSCFCLVLVQIEQAIIQIKKICHWHAFLQYTAIINLPPCIWFG